MPSVVERSGGAPSGGVIGGGQPAWDAPFDERTGYERGFAEIYARVVAPGLGPIAALWRRQHGSRLRRLIGWAILLGGAWAILRTTAWPLHGPALVAAATLGLLALAIALGHILARPRWEGVALRELLIRAACEHMPGLTYQRAAVRRVDYDRHAELGLVPRFDTAMVEDFFAGRHRDISFRMVEADLRIEGRRSVFHGLLLDFDVPQRFSGRVAIRQERDENGRRLAGVRRLARPPGEAVPFGVDPRFGRRFDVHADDAETARALVTESVRIALLRLAESFAPSVWQAGFAYGSFLIALPGAARFFEPSPADAARFDPVGDAHRLLAQLHIPGRIVDTLYGLDPETGERFRPL